MKKQFLLCCMLVPVGVLQAAERSRRVQVEIPDKLVYGNATYDMTKLSQSQLIRYEKILQMAEFDKRQQALNDFFEGIAEAFPSAVILNEQQVAPQETPQQKRERLKQTAASSKAESARFMTMAMAMAKQEPQEELERMEREEVAARAKQQADQARLDGLIATYLETGMSFDQAVEEANNPAGTVRAPIRPRVLDRNGQEVETQAQRCARGEHGACSCAVADAGAAEEIQDLCGVCLKNLEDGTPLASTTCGHEFHKNCLNQALTTKQNCPICRTKQPDSRGGAAAAMPRARVLDFDPSEVARAIEISQAEAAAAAMQGASVRDLDEEVQIARAIQLSQAEAAAATLQLQEDFEAAREAKKAQRRLASKLEQERAVQLAQQDGTLPEKQLALLQKFFQKPLARNPRGTILKTMSDAQQPKTILEQLQIRLLELQEEDRKLERQGTAQNAIEKIWEILEGKYGITRSEVLLWMGENEEEALASLATINLSHERKTLVLNFLKALLPQYN